MPQSYYLDYGFDYQKYYGGKVKSDFQYRYHSFLSGTDGDQTACAVLEAAYEWKACSAESEKELDLMLAKTFQADAVLEEENDKMLEPWWNDSHWKEVAKTGPDSAQQGIDGAKRAYEEWYEANRAEQEAAQTRFCQREARRVERQFELEASKGCDFETYIKNGCGAFSLRCMTDWFGWFLHFGTFLGIFLAGFLMNPFRGWLELDESDGSSPPDFESSVLCLICLILHIAFVSYGGCSILWFSRSIEQPTSMKVVKIRFWFGFFCCYASFLTDPEGETKSEPKLNAWEARRKLKRGWKLELNRRASTFEEPLPEFEYAQYVYGAKRDSKGKKISDNKMTLVIDGRIVHDNIAVFCDAYYWRQLSNHLGRQMRRHEYSPYGPILDKEKRKGWEHKVGCCIDYGG